MDENLRMAHRHGNAWEAEPQQLVRLNWRLLAILAALGAFWATVVFLVTR